MTAPSNIGPRLPLLRCLISLGHHAYGFAVLPLTFDFSRISSQVLSIMKNNNLGTSSPSLAELQYQALHRNDNGGPALKAIASIVIAAATIAVTLRWIARRIVKKTLDIDDLAVLVALVSYSCTRK